MLNVVVEQKRDIFKRLVTKLTNKFHQFDKTHKIKNKITKVRIVLI